jgi:flap endonuclease-1
LSKLLGVNLTPIIVKKTITLEQIRGKTLAVDANNYLYQFLALIRTPEGISLKDSKGNITSHLMGLMFRSTRLIHDYGIKLIFVFDGRPPSLKGSEIQKRRELREKAMLEWKKALNKGDYSTAFSKAVMTSRLTESMINDSKRLLHLLGIPCVQAIGEAEAQAAYMAIRGDVWASSSKDYDTLLFGSPVLVRYLTISGKEFLPSKGTFRSLKPELINLNQLLSHHKITREQLIDLAILIGTDFNEGVKGVGPKTALKLLETHGRLENLPADIMSRIPQNYEDVRKIFLNPKVTPNYTLAYGDLQEKELYDFLCNLRDFSKKRVDTVVQRMKKFYSSKKQVGLETWFTS